MELRTIIENKGKDDAKATDTYHKIATVYISDYPDEVQQFCKEVGLDTLGNEKISIKSKEFEKCEEAYAHLLDQFSMLQKKAKKSSE